MSQYHKDFAPQDRIIGYGSVSPFAFLLIGIILSRTRPTPKDIESNPDVQVAVART